MSIILYLVMKKEETGSNRIHGDRDKKSLKWQFNRSGK